MIRFKFIPDLLSGLSFNLLSRLLCLLLFHAKGETVHQVLLALHLSLRVAHIHQRLAHRPVVAHMVAWKQLILLCTQPHRRFPRQRLEGTRPAAPFYTDTVLVSCFHLSPPLPSNDTSQFRGRTAGRSPTRRPESPSAVWRCSRTAAAGGS